MQCCSFYLWALVRTITLPAGSASWQIQHICAAKLRDVNGQTDSALQESTVCIGPT